MPTTSTGTPYTTYAAGLTEHGTARWGVADAHRYDTGIPTVLYAHGAGGDASQFASLSAWRGLREWLIDNGWAWVEGSGGASGGSQNWGNSAARAAYPAYLARAEQSINIGDVVLLGRSMGGLVTAWLYAHDTPGRYSGWINNSGVSTMFTGDTTGGGASIDKSTGRAFGPIPWAAWGADNYDDWAAAVTGADAAPELWPASMWAGKNILCCYGDADTTVPWYPRGGQALRDVWASVPSIDDAVLRPGGDHSATNGSYLEVAAMTAFLTSVAGPPVPPAASSFYRQVSQRIYLGGELYEVTV